MTAAPDPKLALLKVQLSQKKQALGRSQLMGRSGRGAHADRQLRLLREEIERLETAIAGFGK